MLSEHGWNIEISSSEDETNNNRSRERRKKKEPGIEMSRMYRVEIDGHLQMMDSIFMKEYV
jgi:hypothetical protein